MGFFKFIFSKRFLKHIFAAIIVSIFLIVGLFYWLNYYTNHDEYIEVPDLSKLSIDIVDQKLNDLELRYEITDSTAFNPEFPPYSVVEQNPKPGQFVKESRKIYITTNPKDYALIAIPENIIGKTIRQVEPSLKSLGFKIGEITKRPYIAENEVLELKHNGEEIKQGSQLKKTSIIDIVVGDGSLDYGEEAPEIDNKESQNEGNTLNNERNE
jgi:beta-lactam-binding protein with PASTA domain